MSVAVDLHEAEEEELFFRFQETMMPSIGQYRNESFIVISSYPSDIDKFMEDTKEEFNLDDDIMFEDLLELILGTRRWGFDDEFTKCSYCENIINSHPVYDSKQYFINKGEIACRECVRERECIREEYIKHLINNPDNCNTILDEQVFTNLGFNKFKDEDRDKFTSDWYPGQNDNPNEQLDQLLEEYNEVIFDLVSSHPFSTSWTIWVR